MTTLNHENSTKIIIEDDVLDALTDAICDMMLIAGTSDMDHPRMQKALANAIDRATMLHYPAEKNGMSEGYRIIIHETGRRPYALDGGRVKP